MDEPAHDSGEATLVLLEWEQACRTDTTSQSSPSARPPFIPAGLDPSKRKTQRDALPQLSKDYSGLNIVATDPVSRLTFCAAYSSTQVQLTLNESSVHVTLSPLQI
jgi:hypothetical protein